MVKVVVCSGVRDGGGVVIVLVDTSTLPIIGVVSVTGSMVMGVSVVVTLSGALVGTVVRGVSGAPGTVGGWCVTGFLVVVVVTSADDVWGKPVILEVVVGAADEVAVVTTGCVVSGG